MRLLNKSLTESIYSSLKEELDIENKANESVMINTGSTTITSDETGVTVEDNGNTITTGTGTTVNVDNSMDTLPAEMDLANPMGDIPEEGPIENIPMEEPIEDIPEEPIEDETPEEDLDNSEESDDEEDLDESTVNEEVLEKKDEETEEEVNNSKVEECDKKLKEADGYNQNQNIEIYQNPEFDYQILDITELDNIDSGDIRAIDMANILNGLDESLTEHFGTENWGELNSFLTRKGTHKKTNESYSSAILELILPRLNESVGEFKNVYMLEVYGDKALKECVVRDSKSHIIEEYSGKSKNPIKHFEGVILDIMNRRTLKEEIRDEAYLVAESIAQQYEGQGLITWDDFRDALEAYTNEINPSLLSDENLWDFELEVRDVLSWQYGWATIYEGENEGGLTTEYGDDNQDTEDQNRDNITNEAVEVMVNEPFEDNGVNFADGKAIEKDKKRQENHLKQHKNLNKETKKFKIAKEPDQENTTGEKVEDLTNTEKVDKLPKAKKTKVNAEKLKVKEIKESKELNEMGNFAGRMDTLRAAGDRANIYKQDVINQKNKKIRELFNRLREVQDDVAELKEIDRHINLYKLKDRYGIWLDASGRGLDYEDPDDSDNVLFVDTDKIQMHDGNIATGEVTAEELTEPNPFHHKNVFIKLATEMLDNYPGYIKAVNQMIDDYDLKYPVKSQEEIKESYSIDELKDLIERLIGEAREYPENNPGSLYSQAIRELRDSGIDNLASYLDECYDRCDSSYIKGSHVVEDLHYVLSKLANMNESAKLKEADELLDEPEITDGSDMREGREDLEESGSDVAIFHRKPASVDAMRAAEQNGITVNKSNYKIVGTKELSGDEFNNFASHLSSGSYEWLKEYNDTSNSGEFKCVEVINTDDDSYTLLVDPQGYDYARYAAIKDNLSDEEELIEPEEELLEPEEE